jgi:mannose-6-phosphate isomerase-like protein (cupin superfamily)
MPKKKLRFGKGFSVLFGNGRAQSATMVLGPGETEGGPENRHCGSDQWLFVVSGTGRAIIGGKRKDLVPGTLLLIERGTTHEIRNVGRGDLQTLNFYVPPAYQDDGNPLPRGK